MKWAGIVLLLLGILLVLLFISPIRVHIQYARENNRDNLRIQLQMFFGLFKYTFVLDKIDLVVGQNNTKIETEQKRGIGERVKRKRVRANFLISTLVRFFTVERKLIEKLHSYIPHVREVSKVFQVEKLNWQTHVGLADAAYTGTATGALWSLKGIALGFIAYFLSFRVQPHVSIHPRFHTLSFHTEADCIIRFWLGKAILAGIKLGIYLLREGKKPWQIIRSKV